VRGHAGWAMILGYGHVGGHDAGGRGTGGQRRTSRPDRSRVTSWPGRFGLPELALGFSKRSPDAPLRRPGAGLRPARARLGGGRAAAQLAGQAVSNW
jgi:hypothetical protein